MGMRRVGRHWSVRRDQLVSKQSRRQAVVVDSCETQIKTESSGPPSALFISDMKSLSRSIPSTDERR
ncbi:hypothetical protein OUZ56_008276 [Daphnia magna]|uniref:Uncharacterized protein n=1 Tax=Daphnia magna TaxID=35525 RepID=A0ABR0ACG7_9CRUS|nr:hypothetical protein OUZ56_008276 [Daphnia magna]